MNKNLIENFFKMVQINSESGEEEEFILYLSNIFKDFNARCVSDKYGNLIIKVPAKNCSFQEAVMLAAHADTVKPGKNIKPILRNGIIFSEGDTILGADDKAGIAEIIEAIRTAKQYPPLEIVISIEEERGLKGSKNVDTSLISSKIGFLFDMDKINEIVIGGPSCMNINIKITGKSAHAGMEPEKGISSIKAASFAISKLKDGWIDDKTTVNIGTIKGGENINSVPENTNIKIECRSQLHKKCLYQSNLIKKVFLVEVKALGAQVEIQEELLIKAYQILENVEVVKIAKRALIAESLRPKIRVICGGTDASNYNQKGIQTVVLGTGVKKAHTKKENIAVEEMMTVVNLIKNIFKELCKGSKK